MRNNLFIAFEGIDGSGKSTQVKLLAEQLEHAGHKVYTTFEPTDSPIGKTIRDIFSRRMEADERVIAALFVADRLHHLLNLEDGIIKKLEQGFTVITDRYYLSSYAYHSVHMSMDWVIASNAMCAQLLRPDLHIYIDMPPDESMKRLGAGRQTMEIYETLDNLRKVKENYSEAIGRVGDREHIFSTKGDRPIPLVAADIWAEVSKLVQLP
jgi:dTMP kinase